jgi:hypothetical protein
MSTRVRAFVVVEWLLTGGDDLGSVGSSALRRIE